MFLVNEKKKSIELYDGDKLSQVNGDFHGILEHIKKRYNQSFFGRNIFFENNLIGSSFSKKHDLIIFDLYRTANIIIKKHLLLKFSLQKILDVLYYFKIDTLVQKKKAILYGDFDGFNKECIINSAKKLFDLGIGRVDTNKKYGYNICNLSFSYGLGSYKFKEDIINSSRGVDKNQQISYEKGLSEMIERVSASLEHKVFSYEDGYNYMRGNYIYKEDFKKHQEGGKYVRILPLGFKDETKYYSPEEIIYYPVPYNFSSAISNSNGMATHVTLSQAKEAGLFELIERDCFILMWLLKKGVYKLEIKDLSIKDVLLKIKQNTGIDIYVYVLKFDNMIPVTMMVASKQNRSIVVSGVGITLDESLKKTLKELVGMLDFFDYDASQIRDNIVMSHISHYLDSNNYHKIKRLIDLNYSGIKYIESFFVGGYSFKKLVSYYHNIGIILFFYRYCNNINLIYKRFTVRVLSDNLLPIYFGEQIPLQIYESERLNYRKKYFSVEKINLDIQPFG